LVNGFEHGVLDQSTSDKHTFYDAEEVLILDHTVNVMIRNLLKVNSYCGAFVNSYASHCSTFRQEPNEAPSSSFPKSHSN
jgi:hypothetical protein